MILEKQTKYYNHMIKSVAMLSMAACFTLNNSNSIYASVEDTTTKDTLCFSRIVLTTNHNIIPNYSFNMSATYNSLLSYMYKNYTNTNNNEANEKSETTNVEEVVQSQTNECKSRMIEETEEITEPKYIDFKVIDDCGFKSYMSYRTITCKSSKQYELQQYAKTDSNGLRTYDDYYMIALGTYYAKEAGMRVDLVLSTGVVLQCMTGDVKADKDTDSLNRKHKVDGSMVEFIVDTKSLDKKARRTGDISYISGFDGEIVSIRVYGK